MIPEIMGIIFAVVAVLTLRSTRTKLHLWSLIGALSFWLVDFGTVAYYSYLVNEAMRSLHSLISSYVLSDALQVQQQFEAAYGFWDSSAYYAVRIILVLISLVAFGVACLTAKPKIWKSTIDTPPPSPMCAKHNWRMAYDGSRWEYFCALCRKETENTQVQNATSPQMTPSMTRRTPELGTMFCRYCGAKIPRTSKFCEECGKNLGG